MKKNKILKITALFLVLVTVAASLCGCMLTDILSRLFNNSDTMSEEDKADYILNTVYDYIQNRYADVLTDEELDAVIEAGADAMLGLYDDYGFIINPEQFHDLMYPTASSDNGLYFGFNFTYKEFLGLKVASVVTDSNAYGKLFAGDIIIDVSNPDGSPIIYQSDGETKTLNVKVSDLNTVADALSGVTEIKATVIRGGTYENVYEDGEKLTVTLTREPIDYSYSNNYEYVEYYFGEDENNVSPTTINLRDLTRLDGTDVGYIRILRFSSTYDDSDVLLTDTISEVKAALEMMKSAGKTRLILDLKGNPGGDVDEVKNVAANFIYDRDNSGNLLVTTMKDREETKEYKVKSTYGSYFDATADEPQIVVVTDGNSASASELLLGAMLDYGTCVHVGETSFGKGIAQYIEPILAGSFTRNGKTYSSYYGIYFTAAYYYTPSGLNIHKKGFTPDEENLASDYEEIMDRSLEIFD